MCDILLSMISCLMFAFISSTVVNAPFPFDLDLNGCALATDVEVKRVTNKNKRKDQQMEQMR